MSKNSKFFYANEILRKNCQRYRSLK